MPGDGRAHQGLMERRTRSLDRDGELFGDASVPFPAIFDQALLVEKFKRMYYVYEFSHQDNN